MSKKNSKKRSVPTEHKLTKALTKLSEYCWVQYVVEGEIYPTQEDATVAARKFARLRNSGVRVGKIEIPSAIPVRPLFSVAVPDNDHELISLPSVRIYFVNGVPYLTSEDAIEAAETLSDTEGEIVTIMYARIKMAETDFYQKTSGHKEKSVSAVPSAGPSEGGDA